MSFREGLTALLLSHVPLNELVGQRLHWLKRPSADRLYPYLNMRVVSEPQRYEINKTFALNEARVQVDAWAESYTKAVMISDALKALLSGYSGTIGDVNFCGIFVDNARDLDGEGPEGERPLFGISTDLQLRWKAV